MELLTAAASEEHDSRLGWREAGLSPSLCSARMPIPTKSVCVSVSMQRTLIRIPTGILKE